ELRGDNGIPWGSRGDLPTDLELWLAGLDVPVHFNPSRSPQDNGVVERSHETGQRWGDPGTAANVPALQRVMDQMDRRQREQYPYDGSRSRLACYPALKHSGRAYDAAWEQRHWSEAKARALLADHVVARQVSRDGGVSVYNRNYYVGRAYAQQQVWVRFDPQQRCWLFADQDNHLLNQHPASEISTANIQRLTVTHRRKGKIQGKSPPPG
ncbi:MAG TPA: Mu transposase C-terminal domain-containing protein, partial [Steroidobacteraceae bacterium]